MGFSVYAMKDIDSKNFEGEIISRLIWRRAYETA